MNHYRHRLLRKAPRDHSDDWLMTYADLITLLLCFFTVVVVASVPKKIIPPTVSISQVAPPRQQIPPPLPQPLATPAPDASPTFVLLGDLPFHDVTEDDAANPPPPTTAQQPTGDRITTMEINSAAFFDSGSATLNAGGETILATIADKLKSEPYKDYQITVEGHTDDTPIHTALFPSNWELSTARASAVVHYFLGQNIPPQRLRAAGYADTFPKAPNRDSAGTPLPANQAANRRVVIKLEHIEK